MISNLKDNKNSNNSKTTASSLNKSNSDTKSINNKKRKTKIIGTGKKIEIKSNS